MHFFCAAGVQKLRGFPQLGAANNGVVNQQQALTLNQIVHRNQLHLGDQVALGLVGWHKGAGPSRRVLNKWTRKRNAGGVGITDGVGNAGVRHTSHNVRHGVVSACQQLAAVIAHFFHADPLIGRGRITVIHP